MSNPRRTVQDSGWQERMKQETLEGFLRGEEGKGVAGLPADWGWVKLDDVVTHVQSGFACSRKHQTNEGVPHLRPNNIGFDGKIDLSRIVYLPEELVDLGKYSLRAGDVLFNNTNSRELVGRASLVETDMDCGYSNHITRIRVNRTLVMPEWLVLSINHLWLQGHFLRTCQKWIGQAGVNTRMLKATLIPLPPLSEQERIVARINALFGRIDKIERLRRKALDLSTALMPSILHQLFSEADLRGWDWTRLGDVCEINRESRNPAREMPEKEFIYVDIASVEGGTGRITGARRILGKDSPSRARRVIHQGDVIMSTVRPYLRAFAIVTPEYDNQICSTGFAVLSCTDRLLPEFLLYALLSDMVIEQCSRMMVGAHYPALNRDQVSEIRIPLPPRTEQERIVAYLREFHRKVTELQRIQETTRGKISELRRTLLREALSGRL